MRPDGSEQRRLIDEVPGARSPVAPSFSPDGRQLGFTTVADIWVANPDGSDPRLILTGTGWAPLFPSFGGANGIAFIERPGPCCAELPYNIDESATVEIINANGGGRRVVFENPNTPDGGSTHAPQIYDYQAALSPDGTQVAFEYRPQGGELGLYLINSNGSGMRELTTEKDVRAVAPAFSPDGMRVAFARLVGGHPDIFVINTDGSGLTNVTTSPGWESQPTFSPNGREIALNDEGGIAIVDLTTGVRRSIPGTDDAGNPTWGPDADPPETTFTKDAPASIDENEVKLKFRSDEAGSTFRCKLDSKGSKPCSSPKTLKRLGEGKHRFEVRAIDAAGNPDSTTAKDRFRVVD